MFQQQATDPPEEAEEEAGNNGRCGSKAAGQRVELGGTVMLGLIDTLMVYTGETWQVGGGGGGGGWGARG